MNGNNTEVAKPYLVGQLLCAANALTGGDELCINGEGLRANMGITKEGPGCGSCPIAHRAVREVSLFQLQTNPEFSAVQIQKVEDTLNSYVVNADGSIIGVSRGQVTFEMHKSTTRLRNSQALPPLNRRNNA